MSLITVKLEIKNPQVLEALRGSISSLDGFHLDSSGEFKSWDILILEIGEDLKQEFFRLQSMQTSGKVGCVLLTSPRFEPDVLIQAMRSGVKEFFSQPINPEEVRSALLKLKEGRGKNPAAGVKTKKGEIIHVMGSKGGVGVTTIAVNLAVFLADLDKSKSVALVDMNLLFGEIPIFLDIKSAFDWGEVVKNISRVDTTLLKSILFKHPSRVSVLPSPTGLEGVNCPTPEIIANLLGVMRETFDYTVIDGGQSILDDLSLKTLEMADKVLLATSLSLPCLANLKKIFWTFQKLGFPRREKVKIIINRYQKDSLISLKEAEQSIAHPIFWQVPNDFHLTMSAINQGKTLLDLGNSSEISRNFRKLAESFHVRGPAEKPKEKSGFWNKITRS